MKKYIHQFAEHPLGALYGTLLGIVAFSAALPMFKSGMWDAALVDLVMAALLIGLMMKRFFAGSRKEPCRSEKFAAWGVLIGADILALLPNHTFAGNLTAAFAFSMVICAFVLFFSGILTALVSVVPALWCCVFMPYHEELVLLLSFPLRLSAAALSSWILNLAGVGVVHSGTTLTLSGLNIAITDACSGISQLDAFILVAFVAVQFLHQNTLWKILHGAFIIPAVIVGNSLRIVLTVLLYRVWGETVLENTWHTALGYGQIIFAMVIFLAVGWIFTAVNSKDEGEEKP